MSDQQAAAAAAAAFSASVNALAQSGDIGNMPDEVLKTIFTAAVKAYAARVDKSETEPVIIDTRLVNATEGVTAACALIRAVDLNMFDVTLWYNRSGPNR